MLDTRYEHFDRAALSEIDIGRFVSIFAKLSKAFGRDWNAGVIFGNLDRDPARLERLVAFLQNDCVWESADQNRASQIMGDRFFGVGHAMMKLNEAYTLEQLATLERIPYSSALLESCKHTHILLPGYPLTLKELYDHRRREDIWRVEKGGRPKIDWEVVKSWQEQDFWARRTMEMRWHLIRADYKKMTARMDAEYEHQFYSLSHTEYVPNLVDVLYARWIVGWGKGAFSARLKLIDLTVDGKRLVLDSGGKHSRLEIQTDGMGEYGIPATARRPDMA